MHFENDEPAASFWIYGYLCDYDSTWTHLHLAKQNIEKKKLAIFNG